MKHLLAISLLLLFIAGQVNLTWADHYCMSFKVQSSLMIGHGNLDCGMGEMISCSSQEDDFSGPSFQAPQCCSNDYFSSDSDDHFNKSETSKSAHVTFAVAYVDVLPVMISDKQIETRCVANSPPLIQADKHILYQNFLL